MSMLSTKKILNDWRNFCNLNESRLYAMSPSELTDIEFNKASTSQFVDKTGLSDEEAVRSILDTVIKYRDISISFVLQYQDEFGNDVVPSLGVSPVVRYDTPHGIYTYPLNLDNIEMFLYEGKPTDAEFATDYDYFHLIKRNDVNSITINSDQSTNYDSSKYDSDHKELVRVFLNYVLSFIDENKERARDIFDDISLNVDSFDLNVSTSISDSADDLYRYLYDYYVNRYDTTKSIDNDIVVNVAKFLDELSLTRLNKFKNIAKSDKFYSLYYIAHFCSLFLSKVGFDSSDNLTTEGGLFTIFLSAIGISNITDFEGTGTLHQNEPTQAVYMNISKSDNFELLGTYVNKEFSKDLIDRILEEYYEKGLLSTVKSKKTLETDTKMELDVKIGLSWFMYDLENDFEEIGNYMESKLKLLPQVNNNITSEILLEIKSMTSKILKKLFDFIVDKIKFTKLNLSSPEVFDSLINVILKLVNTKIRLGIIENLEFGADNANYSASTSQEDILAKSIAFIKSYLSLSNLKSLDVFETFKEEIKAA